MWDLDLICDLAAAGLDRRARALDEEESVRGIDCLREVELHVVLREGLGAELPGAGAGAGRFAVLAEQRYPGDRLKPRRSEGERCDIVLLPPTPGSRGGSPAPVPASDQGSPWHRHLLDPLEAGTLFEGLGVLPEDALWLEVKVAGQHAMIDGVGQPNPRYSSVMLREVPRDARKLAADPVIRHAAVLLVMFNADEPTAAHDLEAWRTRSLEKRWPIRTPHVRRFPINDRIGNGVVTVLVCETERV